MNRALVTLALLMLAGCGTVNNSGSTVKDDAPAAAASDQATLTKQDLIGKTYSGMDGGQQVTVTFKSDSQVLWSAGDSIYSYRLDGRTVTITQYYPNGHILDRASYQVSSDLTTLSRAVPDGSTAVLALDGNQ